MGAGFGASDAMALDIEDALAGAVTRHEATHFEISHEVAWVGVWSTAA